MVRQASGEGSPRELAKGQPRDLHPVADIRLVITDVAQLTERIDNLIEKVGELKADGKETRDKLHDVEKSIASAQGAMKILTGLFALALVIMAAVLAWLFKT